MWGRGLVFILVALSCTAAFAAGDEAKGHVDPDDVNLRCKKPKSDLYDKEHSSDALDVQMITAYRRLNTDNGNHKAVVSVPWGQGRDYIPVMLSRRGNSRNGFCEAKPFRMMFLNQEIERKIEADLAKAGMSPSSSGYLKAYYERLLATDVNVNKDVQSQDDNIFDHLGDDVKVVTHCGTAPEMWYRGGNAKVEAQHSRLLGEYYIYEVLAQAKSTVEAVRLAKFTYINENGDHVYSDIVDREPVHYRFAFFREPPNSLAKRCNLLNKRPERAKGNGVSLVSRTQADLLNKLAATTDYAWYGHNLNHLYNIDGVTFYGPYDYDLSAVLRYQFDNKRENIDVSMYAFENALRDASAEVSIPLISRLVAKEEKIYGIFDNSYLTKKEADHMRLWLDIAFDIMHKNLKKNGVDIAELQRGQADEVK